MKKLKYVIGSAIALTLLALSTNTFAVQPKIISGSIYQQKQTHDGNDRKRGRNFQNVYLHLIDENGKVVAETRTDRNGDYQFNNVKPGIYQVQVPSDSDNPKDINRLLLENYASPIGSNYDVEVADSNIRNADLVYFYIDLRTRTTRQNNYKGTDY